MRKILILLLALLLVAPQVLAAGCRGHEQTSLAFKTIDVVPYFEPDISGDLDTQIQVVADWESLPDVLQPPYYPNDVDSLDKDERATLNRVDFTTDFLVFVFATYHTVAAPEFAITRIWQEENTIYVQASFDWGTYAPPSTVVALGENVSFRAVSVERAGLSAYGHFAMVLIDKNGASIATSDAVIPAKGLPVTSPVTFFPVQQGDAGIEPTPQEWAGGELVLENGYLRLSLRPYFPSQLLVWPAGWKVRMNTGRLEVVCEHGDIIIVPGYSLDFRGWAVDDRTVERHIGQPLPPDCTGPYFIIHEVDPRFF